MTGGLILASFVEEPMPYPTNADLPPSVRSHLPEHAQEIYREAFNHAFAAHAGEARQEEAAHRIAWAAVKRSYVKVGNSWIDP
jgi:cation transport regulator